MKTYSQGFSLNNTFHIRICDSIKERAYDSTRVNNLKLNFDFRVNYPFKKTLIDLGGKIQLSVVEK